MTVKDVIKFLETRPGYYKEGSKRLSEKVLKGKADVETCRLALKLFNKQLDLPSIKLDKKEREGNKVLIWDIETSYNIVSSWRVGSKINLPHYSIIKERAIICISYKWLGEDQVYTLTWDKNQDDKFMLEQFIDVMNEADILVAHFGDKFDMKWVKTRALKHGLEMLPNYVTVDTKWLASKHFYLNSNKLDYIAKFLGFEGKIQTEPELWDKIILEKDIDALKSMITYCITPDHKLLKNDLNWVQANSLKEGDIVLGFDENTDLENQSRNYKNATITKIVYDTAPVYEVVLSNGDKIKVTSEHRWLCKMGNSYQWLETNQLRALKNKDGSWGEQSTQISKLFSTWKKIEDYGAGYFGGVLDGEGYFQLNGNKLGFAQRDNIVFKKSINQLKKYNIPFMVYKGSGTNKDVNVVQINGGLHSRIKCLGLFRPERLISKVNFDYFGRLESRNETVRVLEINSIGEKEIIKISTTAKTFVCEGYPMHNCEEDVRQLEKVYNKLKVWDKPKQHAGVGLFDDKISSPISGSKDLEYVKTTSTNAGTKKHIMRDLSTDRLFEMSDVNYKKWLKE